MKHFRYKNLLIYSSLQSVGHVEDYFVEHTEKLVVFIVMPRPKSRFNIIRLYNKGKLANEKKTWSVENFILYYLTWYLTYLYIIFRYFSPQEHFVVFSGQIFSFFGMSVQKIFRRVDFAYWLGDYFPPNTWTLRVYEWAKKFYHDRIRWTCYLSDRENKILNGRIIDEMNKKTVMWGVKSKEIVRRSPSGTRLTFLFVGLVRPSQGLELIFQYLKHHPKCRIKIIGICDNEALFQRYQAMIKNLGIAAQVYFPNKFFTDKELTEISRDCHVGVAPYHLGPTHAEYYGDPGKIKTYAELGLPIIISNTTAIIPYIRRFHSGEIIQRNVKDVERAVSSIRRNYSSYIKGVSQFNKFFSYESYYRNKFSFLESDT
ncbi:glycosyltransferase [Candidatus Gottesmanbacteria bacterium]|nr:glycosyltransferase [Candidatus Gottesmanbacteria bacterium]